MRVIFFSTVLNKLFLITDVYIYYICISTACCFSENPPAPTHSLVFQHHLLIFNLFQKCLLFWDPSFHTEGLIYNYYRRFKCSPMLQKEKPSIESRGVSIGRGLERSTNLWARWLSASITASYTLVYLWILIYYYDEWRQVDCSKMADASTYPERSIGNLYISMIWNTTHYLHY